jgi:hypothetical protein
MAGALVLAAGAGYAIGYATQPAEPRLNADGSDCDPRAVAIIESATGRPIHTIAPACPSVSEAKAFVRYLPTR